MPATMVYVLKKNVEKRATLIKMGNASRTHALTSDTLTMMANVRKKIVKIIITSQWTVDADRRNASTTSILTKTEDASKRAARQSSI